MNERLNKINSEILEKITPGFFIGKQIDALINEEEQEKTLLQILGSDFNEGLDIPDGASDSFVKTVTLEKNFERVIVIIREIAPQFPLDLQVNFREKKKLIHPSIIDGHCFLVTMNYENCRRFSENISIEFEGGATHNETDPNTGFSFSSTFNKTYTQIGNFVLGYYYYGGINRTIGFPTASKNTNTFAIESMYLNGNQLTFCFKKVGSSSSNSFISNSIMCYVETIV